RTGQELAWQGGLAGRADDRDDTGREAAQLRSGFSEQSIPLLEQVLGGRHAVGGTVRQGSGYPSGSRHGETSVPLGDWGELLLEGGVLRGGEEQGAGSDGRDQHGDRPPHRQQQSRETDQQERGLHPHRAAGGPS